MSMLRRFFRKKEEVEAQMPQERPETVARRELTERLIDEHKSANETGRTFIEERAKRQTTRYLKALNEAMVILGDRG